MRATNFPSGFSQQVTIRGVPVLNTYPGKVFWVDSTAISAGKGTFDKPFTNLTDALSRCTANDGDLILVKAGHAETVSGVAGIAVNVAGVSIIGLGSGAVRPKFTFGTALGTSMLISAASVTIENIIGISALDAITNPFHITGSDCYLDIEWQDSLVTVEAECAVLAATVSRFFCKIKYKGFIAGNACKSAVQLAAVTGARIIVDAYGEFSVGIVDMLTTLSTDVLVTGYFYNDNAALSKNVKDTITSSVWYAYGYDGKGGYSFSGGSAATLAADDIGTVAAAAVANAAQVLKLDGATIATNPTAASLASFIASGGTALGTQLPTTCSLYDVLAGANGIPTFPASAAPANTVSMAEVLREVYDQQEKGIGTAAAVIAAGTSTLFTVAGGPIMLLYLLSVCITSNDATATLLKYSADPTDGAATDLCAATATLASAAAGTIVNITGTVANAGVITVAGTAIAQLGQLLVPIGIITATTSGGATTGTWKHYLRYKPLGRGVTVTAAF